VTIARFDFPYEAHLLIARLNAEGIPAFIRDEHMVRMNLFYSFAIGRIKVEVPISCNEEALKILATDHSHELDDLNKNEEDIPKTSCPECGSNQSESIVKGMIPTVLSWLLIGVPMLFRRYRTKCLACGNIFKQTSN